jgi:hypothetical protein
MAWAILALMVTTSGTTASISTWATTTSEKQ